MSFIHPSVKAVIARYRSSGLKRLIADSGVASVDQALLSGLGFAISVALIKLVSKADYGYYAIGLPALLFLVSVQNAVVNAPLTILLASKRGPERRHYVASLLYGQFILIIPLTLLSLGTIYLLGFLGWDATLASIAAAISLASIGVLFREFLRTAFFAEQKPFTVLKFDGFYVAAFVGIGFLLYWSSQITVASVFLSMGACAFLTSLLYNPHRAWKYDHGVVRKSYRENWEFGRWALVGVVVTHLQNYSYLYLIGVLLGSEAAADVSASRLLLMPLILLETGWARIILPHGSILRERKQGAHFFKLQILASIFFAAATLFFTFLVLKFSSELQSLVLSEKYASALTLIIWWGLYFVATFITLNASYGLQVMKQFDVIAVANSFTMVLTVVLAYFLIQSDGVRGGLIALIIGQSTLAVLLWIYFRKSISRFA